MILAGQFHKHRRGANPCGNVKKPGARTVRGRIPASPTRIAGIHKSPLQAWSLALHSRWSALFIESTGPCDFDERLTQKEFSCSAIKHVKKAVPVGPQDDLALLTFPLDVGQDWNLNRIKVEIVVRRELKIPLQFSGVRVQRNRGIAVEIVSGPCVRIPVRAGVPCAPIG